MVFIILLAALVGVVAVREPVGVEYKAKGEYREPFNVCKEYSHVQGSNQVVATVKYCNEVAK